MIVTPVKTKKVVTGDNLEKVLDDAIPKLEEHTVIVISAKIISICEGAVVANDGKVTKEELTKKEADYFIFNKKLYDEKKTILTIKNNILIPSSGVDESNGNGYFILWPKDPMQSAEKIWTYLRNKHQVKELGIIISDSYFVPMRRGAVGVGMSWCGFVPVDTYIGKPDLFDRTLLYTNVSRIDGLAAAGEATMGEGAEQTPIALITDVPFVNFVDRVPTKEEIKFMNIGKDEDAFGSLLNAMEWEKGNSK